jgi:flagellar protein FlbD
MRSITRATPTRKQPEQRQATRITRATQTTPGGFSMIQVTRLNNSVLLINAENIQSVEANPDTVITFVNRDRLMVKERAEEVSQRIVQYRRVVQQPAACGDGPPDGLRPAA